MSTPELIENYRYWRARNYAAFNALAKARDELVIGKRRYGACKPTIAYSPRNAAGEGFVENAEGTLRTVFADEVEGVWIDHKGWYCDEFQDRTLRGVVVRLPHGRCFPAYRESDNGGLMVDWSDCRDEAKDAARAADSFAEHAAEEEREYNEAWQAGSRWAYLGQEIAETRTHIIETCAELREARKANAGKSWPAICEAMRVTVRNALRSIAKHRKERAELRSNYAHRNAFYPERTLTDAFNEGAGL